MMSDGDVMWIGLFEVRRSWGAFGGRFEFCCALHLHYVATGDVGLEGKRGAQSIRTLGRCMYVRSEELQLH